MNYSKAINASTGGNIPLSAAGRINIQASGAATNVIVDVTGYYVKPLFASVNGDGSLVSGSRTTGSTRSATGIYEVDFDRDVSGCSYSAATYSTGLVFVEPRTTNRNGVYVETQNVAQTDTDIRFYLTVTC